jgi:hypothetical protein
VSVRRIETDPHAPPPRPDRPSRTAHRLGALLLFLALGPSLTACGQDYCDSVADHQAELTDLTASGSAAALLSALPVFEDLADDAPDDIADEWRTFLDALDGLDAALRDADVDPASYDDKFLPAGLTDEQRQRIEDAAIALADPAVVAAFDGVQQHAKDVCHTPLTL